MHPDEIVVAAGTRFAISDRTGDIGGIPSEGFYAFDTRFLSEYGVTVQGKRLVLAGAGNLDHSAASFYCTNAGSRDLPAGSISIARDRYVAEGMHEDITLVNHSRTRRTVRLALTFDVDFADVFEVRRGAFTKVGSVILESNPNCQLCFLYQRNEFERRTFITLTGNPEIKGRVASFEVTLEPKQQWKTCVTIMPVLDEVPEPMECVEMVIGPPFGAYQRKEPEPPLIILQRSSDFPLESVPELVTANRDLAATYRQAVADLRSLRMEYSHGLPILAAGLPWFMAVFGRDSIISAIQTKLLGPELMLGTLHTLAGLQATEVDDFRDAAPGKIPHEIRMGELSVLEETPHSRYYGTADATPLFLRLIHEAYLWTGDADLIRVLLPSARAAIGWIDRYGDIDGDGFIEYRRRTRAGLLNQGWKDSHDSVSFADGRLAEGPIALAEVQGYAYDAKVCTAALLRIIGENDEAQELEEQARRLKQAFNEAFWMPEEGFFAMALDGRKRRVNAITSNPGHCLWSGIVDEDKAAAVVECLMSPQMFSGWGIRTLSTAMGQYAPLSYHNGSVWPHDNSIIAAGMARYGFRKEAATVATAILEAAAGLPDHRLPELFAGFPRREHSFPVPYPAANAPQAWASGAVIYLLEVLLGIEVRREKLSSRPLPSPLGPIHLRGFKFRGMEVNL